MVKKVIVDNTNLFDKGFIQFLLQLRALNYLKSKDLINDHMHKNARVQMEKIAH